MNHLFINETTKHVYGIVDRSMDPLIKFRHPDRLKGDEPSASGDESYDKRASDIWRHSRANVSTSVLGSVRRARRQKFKLIARGRLHCRSRLHRASARARVIRQFQDIDFRKSGHPNKSGNVFIGTLDYKISCNINVCTHVPPSCYYT